MQDYPSSDLEVKKMAAMLWQNCDGKTVKMVHYGKGMVLNGMTMEEAFATLKVVPDFKTDTSSKVLYTHRKTANADIYFISNQKDTTLEITPEFRVAGKQPEWWDATDGSARVLAQYTRKGEAVAVP